MTTSHGVGTQQGDHFSIIESHASQDGTDMISRLFERPHGGIGKSIFDIGLGSIGEIFPSETERNGRTSGFFNGDDTDIRVEIGVRHVREFGLDGFQRGASFIETSIVAVSGYGGWRKYTQKLNCNERIVLK